jgi:hypothetical protein
MMTSSLGLIPPANGPSRTSESGREGWGEFPIPQGVRLEKTRHSVPIVLAAPRAARECTETQSFAWTLLTLRRFHKPRRNHEDLHQIPETKCGETSGVP